MASQQQQEEELKRVIRESKRKSMEIERRAGALLKTSRYASDLADASENRMQYPLPPNFNRGAAIDAWQFFNEQQDNIIAGMGPGAIPAYSTYSGSASYAMTYLADPAYVIQNVPVSEQIAARAATEQLAQVIDMLATDRQRVLSLFRQFGLDSPVQSGEKSPAELFEIAWAAYEKPVTQSSPVNTSLIPMRECINATIDGLLRRRSTQERAKSQRDKIESIHRQLAWDIISKAAGQSLADRWHNLVDELSGFKKGDYSRAEWLSSLRRATLFLLELLQSVDPAK